MADVNPMTAIEIELQGERASALGEAGRRLDKAVSAYAGGETEETLDELATAVWHYMIIREAVGMFDHKAALAIYQVPPHVMARVGIVKRDPDLR